MSKAELPGFTTADFAAYEEKHQRDPEYNAHRLAVRRKLDSFGKAAKRMLKSECDLDLATRTSLNHPYKYNAGRVNAQWVYLSRTPKDKKALNALVGPALAKDVDTHYIQTTLVLSIDDEGIEQALRIHALAWWDGINLKNKVQDRVELENWTELLNGLPEGFILFMDRWLKQYPAGTLAASDLRAYFRSSQPGEHWLNLRRRIPIHVAVELGSELKEFAFEGFRALAAPYRYLCWTPGNNSLFDAAGRIRRIER